MSCENEREYVWEESTNMLGVMFWKITSVGSVSITHGSSEYKAFSWLSESYQPLGKFDSLNEAKSAVIEHADRLK